MGIFKRKKKLSFALDQGPSKELSSPSTGRLGGLEMRQSILQMPGPMRESLAALAMKQDMQMHVQRMNKMGSIFGRRKSVSSGVNIRELMVLKTSARSTSSDYSDSSAGGNIYSKAPQIRRTSLAMSPHLSARLAPKRSQKSDRRLKTGASKTSRYSNSIISSESRSRVSVRSPRMSLLFPKPESTITEEEISETETDSSDEESEDEKKKEKDEKQTEEKANEEEAEKENEIGKKVEEKEGMEEGPFIRAMDTDEESFSSLQVNRDSEEYALSSQDPLSMELTELSTNSSQKNKETSKARQKSNVKWTLKDRKVSDKYLWLLSEDMFVKEGSSSKLLQPLNDSKLVLEFDRNRITPYLPKKRRVSQSKHFRKSSGEKV